MKINLIVLASGFSKRFNGNKLLEKIKDKELYKYTIDKIEGLQINKAIIVTKYKEIEEYASTKGIKVIKNQNSENGISESIKIGINFDKECDAYMFMVCDQPFTTSESINELIKIFKENKKGIASLSYKGSLGNPKIFSRKYFNELNALKGDNGGRTIIKENFKDVILVEVDNKLELFDIDTKEELREIS